MSKRKGKTNIKLEALAEIYQIVRRLKRKKVQQDGPLEEMEKLLRRRDTLKDKLKTNK